MKHGGLGIPDPWLLAERAYNTSKAAIEVLVGSLLGGTYLNHVGHTACVRRSSADARENQEYSEIKVLNRRNNLADGAGLNHLRHATENGACLTAIPQHLNGT